MLSESDIVVSRVADTFDALGIEYAIGGSVASSVHGIPRLTRDVDFIAAIQLEHIVPLVAALTDDFYIDADMIAEAIRTSGSFNIIHLPTMLKADIFLKRDTPWTNSEWARRSPQKVGPNDDSPAALVVSAEDMILQKLEWYRLTGERSDKQWDDIQGMFKVQAKRLDYTYLEHWAQELDLTRLLTQAREDARQLG